MLVNSVEYAWQTFPRGLPSTGRPRMAHIMSAVSLHTGIGADDIKSRRRTNAIIFARQIYCYLARTMTLNSHPQIGLSIGRDHTTIMHAVSRVEEELAKGNESFVEAVALCKATSLNFAGGHE